MADHHGIPLRAVLAEVFLKLGGGLGLDMTDRCAEAVLDAHQSGIGATIPRLVGDRPWCQEGNFHSARGSGCSGFSGRLSAFCAAAGHGEQRDSVDKPNHCTACHRNIHN